MTTHPHVIEHILPNGLTILLRESHDAPLTSFWVVYRVGSRNELPGATGISHWVEHMQFKGTPTLAKGAIFGEVSRNGGTLNAFTSFDWTAYFTTMPSDRVELSIRIEADRMANSLFDPAETESERTVILSERQGAENRPGYFLGEEMMGTAFHHHPYGHMIIGYESDLRRITRDELHAHYRAYYTPSNAVVVVAGDFAADDLLARIETAFGDIPAGQRPPTVGVVEPPQRGERRVTLRRPAPSAMVRMGYRAPAATHADTPALMIADAILSGAKPMGMGGGASIGRSARIYRALVETGKARGASSDFDLMIDPFLMSFSATALPGGDPAVLEEMLTVQIDRLASETPSEQEVARAIKQMRAQVVYSGEGVSSQAFWLGNMAMVDRWQRALTLADELAAVTPDDVQRVVRTWLRHDQRVVGTLIPSDGPGGGAASADASAAFRRFAWTGFGDLPAGAARVSEANSRHFERIALGSGIVVLGQAQPDDPAVSARIRLLAGAAQDPADLPGVAHLTARTMLRGAGERSFAEINDLTDGLGSSIGISAGRGAIDLSIVCLAEDLPTMLDLASDVVRRPHLPAAELEKIRQESRGSIRESLDSTAARAERAMREMVYPESHPARPSILGDLDTIERIDRAALVDFHATHLGPNAMVAVAVGGIASVAHFATMIEEHFGDWGAPATRPDPVPAAVPLTTRARADVAIDGKSQADVAIGFPTVPRLHPDYYALDVANLILGRLGLYGRLGANVRDLQGLAYYAYSGVDSGKSGSLWVARAGVDPGNVDRAVASILAEVARLRSEPVSEQELADAKSFLTGSLPLALERNAGIVELLLAIDHHGLALDLLDRYPRIIEAITVDEVLAAARQHLDEDRVAIGVAGPAMAG